MAAINDHLQNENLSEAGPLTEGFMVPIVSKKKMRSFNTTTTTSRPILTTTCCYAVTTVTALRPPSIKLRLGRALPELTPIKPRANVEDENEFRSFLDVDDDILTEDLMNSRMLMDGSGDSKSSSEADTFTKLCFFLLHQQQAILLVSAKYCFTFNHSSNSMRECYRADASLGPILSR
jgi:hypothetical protein